MGTCARAAICYKPYGSESMAQREWTVLPRAFRLPDTINSGEHVSRQWIGLHIIYNIGAKPYLGC